jgi:tetratricopeptide (TPR) repeat protein
MAKTILTILIVKSQLVPRSEMSGGAAAAVNIAEAGEADIVEQVSDNRQAYQQGLELLVKYYTRTGNNMKLEWARKELAALDTMPKYKYILEASVAPANLKASTLIPEADTLYSDALKLEKKAGLLGFIKNENLLRLALGKYNQLVRKHPYSDKIDDAAYRAGGIYEHFKDYTIALLYYQRAYQWDPDTTHPARFKAAYASKS